MKTNTRFFKKSFFFLVIIFCSWFFARAVKTNHRIGGVIDQFNRVEVYYNGNVRNISGRNVTKDGYNLGLKYQCVEFVKRYYYQHYNHKMPNSYGHAKHFFKPSISDGGYNSGRDLQQFTNPSYSKPKVGDIVVFKATRFSRFGHVAIISKVHSNRIQIIQQNSGYIPRTRLWIDLRKIGRKWKIRHYRIVGWLRKK